MAVVVPTYLGDIGRVARSLKQWSSLCSSSTATYMDLIMYYTGTEDTMPDGLSDEFNQPAPSCFKSRKIIYARLKVKEMTYPIGPTVQFYKLFLDDEIKKQVSSYDMLAWIEWDVVVTHETSFDRLYSSAFGSDEAFWVKGSALVGDNFHTTVTMTESWHVLGHLNGNAIYNNTDKAFTEFLNYARNQWGHNYPFDVAIWATISDFPYSWLLWQHYSRKFVASSLIANVGFLDVTHETLRHAVNGETMFVRGSSIGAGGKKHRGPSGVPNRLGIDSVSESECTQFCGGSVHGPLPKGTSTTCDPSCSRGGGKLLPRFGGYMCGVGDRAKYGKDCRLCFTDIEEAQKEEMVLWHRSMQNMDRGSNNTCHERQHVIMCDTLSPPPAKECDWECTSDGDAICDATCNDQRFGAYNCGFRGYTSCRPCFNDEKIAREADTNALHVGGRVVMCDTHEPPLPQFCNRADTWDPKDEVEDDDSVNVDVETSERSASINPYRTRRLDHEDYCVVLRGYQHVLAETILTVESVHHFMKGAEVVIATNPHSFFSFSRQVTINGDDVPDVTIYNSTVVNYAELWADQMCNNTQSFIYYIEPGTIVMRDPLVKDIYSPLRELLVSWYEIEKVPLPHQRRALVSSILLGFKAPSFSFATDLILPREINAEARKMLA
ncbi:unnamed protein product, partial [Choristocarpus tenellus]